MSPLSRNYKTGSVIYFEGEKAENVFVLQKGIVSLSYYSPETMAETRESIKSGEFFGVKSALGRYPREETAQILSDSNILVFSIQEFETVVMKNHKLVMKMLKVFSNQLRRIGKSIHQMLESGEGDLPANELFKIGEYYLKNKKFNQALYAFTHYLKYYPNGQYAAEANQRIEMAKSGAQTGYAIAGDSPADDTSAVSSALGTGSSVDSAKKYYEAFAFFSQGKFDKALQIYRDIISNSEDIGDEFVEKSYLESGKSLVSLGKHSDAINTFTELIKNFPNSANMKETLFLIGKSNIELGDVEKGKSFLQKVIGMPPNESINKKAQVLLEGL